MSTLEVFAPATVANVAVGFDVLGFCVGSVGDRARVTLDPSPGVRIVSIEGLPEASQIPTDSATNTTAVALSALARRVGYSGGFRVELVKGIALGSGMGGSAASAVAGALAGNLLLDSPLRPSELLEIAVEGEAVASGAAHADNAAPCLFGGLTLVVPGTREVLRLPVPEELSFALVRPRQRLDTRLSRAVLGSSVPLSAHVRQSARLAAFVSACHLADYALIGRVLEDLVIEPQRRGLIPGFDAVKASALAFGALGASIAGAGPAIFALARGTESAAIVKGEMERAFFGLGIACEGWSGLIDRAGARPLDPRNAP
ncbi:MAG: homoserine kinase [Deltaproteobacteria bacterium]|nr:homoserine kinase [Deltaproteobacteria bacterium]